MASYILRDENMTEAEFVERRNAYLYAIWLEGVERDREEAALRAKANRELHPEVEFLADGVLWQLLTLAHGAVKTVHSMWGHIDSDKAHKMIRDANELYFMYRHEHDYRQAQGC